MKKKIVLFTTIIIITGLLAVGFSCQKEDETAEISQVTPIPTPSVTSTPASTSPPEITEKEADLSGQVYTNETFGYKITLPEGYKAYIEETQADRKSGGDRDRVTIKDAKGDGFATIYTPMLETGFEVWTIENEKEIAIPGTDKLFTWKKMLPTAEGGATEGKILVLWGDTATDYENTGMITHSFSPEDESSVATFEEMVRTFRFI